MSVKKIISWVIAAFIAAEPVSAEGSFYPDDGAESVYAIQPEDDTLSDLEPYNVRLPVGENDFWPENEYAASSGVCGDSVSWTLDGGVLTVSGSGAMYDYKRNAMPPWDRGSVKSVIVGEGVTSVGNYAFAFCSALTSVQLAESVTSIGEYALCGCNILKSANIPGNVSAIGKQAFCCEKLTDISVSGNNKYFSDIDGVLYDKSASALLHYPSGKTAVSFSVPDTVKTIGDCAFYCAVYLTDIVIPSGVVSIGDEAFAYCSRLRGAVIPDSVTSAGESVFYNCSAIQTAVVGSGLETLPYGIFQGCSALESVRLGKNLKTIERWAFCWCRSLESVVIPDSVVKIGDEVFWCCLSLESVFLGSRVGEIGSEVFAYCEKLTRVNMPESMTKIGSAAFYGCKSLKSVVIPSGVSVLGGGKRSGSAVFGGCVSLESVVLPQKLTGISEYLFYECKKLKSVTIPDGVTSVGAGAFKGCTSLESVSIPDSVLTIGTEAFSGCSGLTGVKLPKELIYIGPSAFYACFSLKSAEIPEGTFALYDKAFYGCTSLSSVRIPDSVTQIGEQAFITYSSSAEYTYELYALSEVGSEIFDGMTNYLFIKTNNPDPAGFSILTDATVESQSYISSYPADIKVNDPSDKNIFKAVNGGYLWQMKIPYPGEYRFIITENSSEKSRINIAASFTLTVHDSSAETDEWMDGIIASQTTADMTNFEKMSAISSYLLSRFRYLTNSGGKLVSLASEPNSPYFRSYRWDSCTSPSALCSFAFKIGGFNTVADLYNDYMLYGYTWENGHYLCYCAVGDEHHVYAACPLTRTGAVEVKTINFTDPSQLYPVKNSVSTAFRAETVRIYANPGSYAGIYAKENGLLLDDPASVPPSKPVTVKSAAGAQQAVVVCSKVSGAVNYRLFYTVNNGKSYVKAGDSKTRKWTVTGLKAGVEYKFLVLVSNGKKWSSYKKGECYAPATPTLPNPAKIKSTAGKGQATVVCSTVTGAKKYRLYYTTNNGKTYTAVGNTTTRKWVVKNLKAGVTYKFLVRVYDGKNWSAYTKGECYAAATVK